MMKTTKASKKKFLLGLAVSLMLAMAIGSFAIGENQTPVTPLAAEPISDEAGAFTVTATDGETVLTNSDYSYDSGVLTIKSTTPMTIKNTNTGSTTDRIKVDLTSDSEANITLDGVNINTDQGAAFEIKDDATFNVNITLADDSENTLTATSDGYAGLQKNGDSGVGMLTISGTGQLTATGGLAGAGIGSRSTRSGSNITISGGAVTANGGLAGAGIGSGESSTGSNIKITGGTVTATGGSGAAGIGGGNDGDGKSITISGGKVTAKGGQFGAGIGGGAYKGESNITISGGVVTATGGSGVAGIGGGIRPETGIGGNSISNDNVVVIAQSGDASKAALEGFSTIDKGLIFTKQGSSGAWSVDMYSSSVDVTADVTIPANLTVGAGKSLTVDSGATFVVPDSVTLATSDDGQFTVADGGTLQNDGTIADDANINGTGNITTRTHFYLTDGTTPYGTDDYYQIYKAGGNVQKYTNLPNPDDTTLLKNSLNSDKFIYWYYLNGSTEVKIDNSKDVEPNQHKFYEKRATSYAVTIPTFENGSVTSDVTEAAKDETVTLTVTPAEGYELQENSLNVMAGTTAVTVTKGTDGKYTFTMPNAAVTVSAVFEGKTHEVTIDKPENGTVTVNPEKPKTGDEVTITLKPDDGYKPGGAPVVKDESGNEIELTPTGNPNEYKFTMPNSDLTVDVNFVPDSTPTPPGPQPGPEPTPTPEPTPDPSVDPDGDGSGSGSGGASSKTSDPFMGGVALALLGVATTGAVLVRKRK